MLHKISKVKLDTLNN